MHAHQPVGNFGWVFERAYEKCYKPFFEVLERHPGVRVNCHFSGPVIDWIETNRPAFIDRLKKLAADGQIELLGGAYYEPICGMIPAKDLNGQIGLMSAKLEGWTGRRPAGAWLAERVWDPELVPVLQAAGFDYTVLDDAHLERAGAEPPAGWFGARHADARIGVFSSLQALRYLMPFRKPEETIRYLRRGPAEPAVFADDLEKFGLWPGTYAWVYVYGWLDRFFSLLEKERDLKICTFSRYAEHHVPRPGGGIPHGSYAEMMQWCDGRFENFLERYPEAGYARERMLAVSRSLESMPHSNGSGAAFEEARRALYKAQCNCAYWHGVFGGHYAHHLRAAVFENVLRAERRILNGGAPGASLERFASGTRLRLRHGDLQAFIHPGLGGAVEEIDYLPKDVNLVCTVRRCREAYHGLARGDKNTAAIYRLLGVKEKDLDKHLHYDRHRRLCFLDHFFAEEAGLEALAESALPDIGDFAGGAYEPAQPDAARAEAVLTRRGTLKRPSGAQALEVRKRITLDETLEVEYAFTNPGARKLSFVFGCELNLSISPSEAARRTDERFRLADEWRGLSLILSTDRTSVLTAAPIESVSESDTGLGRVYQQTALLLQVPVELEPGRTRPYRVALAVSHAD